MRVERCLTPVLVLLVAIPLLSADEDQEGAPIRALVVDTRENGSCGITRQEILQDVTAELARTQGGAVRVLARSNPEDVFDRREILVFFSAGPARHLAGSIIVRLRCEGSPQERSGILTVISARMREEAGHWTVALQVSGRGTARAAIAYSRIPRIREMLRVCQEGDGRLQHVKELDAYPIDRDTDPALEHALHDDRDEWKIPLSTPLLDRAESVDRCHKLLLALDERFATGDSFLVWDAGRISENAVKEVVAALAGRSPAASYHVLIKPADGREVALGQPNFLARVRRDMAVRREGGEPVPCEIQIGVD